MRRLLLAAAAPLALCQPATARDGYDVAGRPLVCSPLDMVTPDEAGKLVPDEEALKVCRNWVGSVTQPEYNKPPNLRSSCCGDGDAFITDDFETDKDGNLVAIITEDYSQWGKPKGTKVVVPNIKMNNVIEDKNPTKHGVIFIGSSGEVLCYLGPWGN